MFVLYTIESFKTNTNTIYINIILIVNIRPCMIPDDGGIMFERLKETEQRKKRDIFDQASKFLSIL